MDKVLKDRWVTALRDGSFTQGRGSLFQPSEHTYCCVGVLCRIGGFPMDDTYQPEGSLTANALVAAGITEDDLNNLADMNDKEMLSFSKIADYIEDYVA